MQDMLEYDSADISISGISEKQRCKYIGEVGLTMKRFIDWANSAAKDFKIIE